MVFAINPATPPSGALLSEPFNYPDGLITNEYAFWNASDPTRVVSSTWEINSGSLFASGGAGWTGVPDTVDPNATSSNGNNSAVFRLTTKSAGFGDVSVSFSLLNQALTGSSSTSSDGFALALRYQSENDFYYLSFNRRDNRAAIRKKMPSGSSGTYYDLSTYVTRTVPYGQWQQLQATIKNNSDGSVTIQMFADGVLLSSATDNGKVGGSPISAAGKVGLRGDNDNFKFDNFVIAPFTGSSGTLSAGASRPTAPAAAKADLSAVRVFPNPWRVDRHAGSDVTIDGLTQSSEVRIFTVSGRWVRTIAAPDGTGRWDLRNDAGQRVASGVYLYLITDSEGRRGKGTVTVIR